MPMRRRGRLTWLSDREVESVLDKVLSELILKDFEARGEKITRADLTPEFISKWRDDHLYPTAKVTLDTKYGGYNGTGRTALTCQELAEHARQATEFFRQFQK